MFLMEMNKIIQTSTCDFNLQNIYVNVSYFDTHFFGTL